METRTEKILQTTYLLSPEEIQTALTDWLREKKKVPFNDIVNFRFVNSLGVTKLTGVAVVTI